MYMFGIIRTQDTVIGIDTANGMSFPSIQRKTEIKSALLIFKKGGNNYERA